MIHLVEAAVICGTGFFLITYAVFFDSPVLARFDIRAERLAAPFKTPGWSKIWSGITFFGSSIGILIASFCVIALTHFDIDTIIRGMVAVAGSAAIVQFVKLLVARMRPEKLPWRSPELEFSYPSGHTAAAASLYGFAALVLGATLPAWLIAAALFVLLIGFSRMTLSVHYASDVLGGLLLGIFGLLSAFIIPL